MSTRPPVPGTLLALGRQANPVEIQLWTRLDNVEEREPPTRPQLWIFEAKPGQPIRAQDFVDLIDIPLAPKHWWSRTQPLELDLSGRSLFRQKSDQIEEVHDGYPAPRPDDVRLVLTYTWRANAFWHPIEHHLVPFP